MDTYLGDQRPNSTSQWNSNNTRNISPGHISVATVGNWPSYYDVTNGNEIADTYLDDSMTAPRTPDIGQEPPPVSLLAVADIRLRSRYPIQVTCPHCTTTVVTMIVPKRGLGSYLGCCLLSILCLCCIPLFLPSLQDIQHYCPHCSQLIGVCTAI